MPMLFSDIAVATEKGACLDTFMLEQIEVTLEATNPSKILQKETQQLSGMYKTL